MVLQKTPLDVGLSFLRKPFATSKSWSSMTTRQTVTNWNRGSLLFGRALITRSTVHIIPDSAAAGAPSRSWCSAFENEAERFSLLARFSDFIFDVFQGKIDIARRSALALSQVMPGDIRIDVIIATYNRCGLLRITLDSLLKAHVPSGLDVTVVVVDNNSTDDTRAVAQAYEPKFQGRLKYILEQHQGKSYALNAGIAGTNGDLVGMIDDDEQVDVRWFEVVHEWFSRSDIDFIGGPYKPTWEIKPPEWLPTNYPAVIGRIDEINEVRTFGVDYPGMLLGGNAVIRRAIFEQIGPYSTSLGPAKNRLLRGEDDDMYERLIAAEARGKYVPDLIIYHYIPASRLTKSYHRSWCFWKGVSRSIEARQRREQVPHVFGVPRYRYGDAVRRSVCAARNAWTGKLSPSEALSAELVWWDLAGCLYGRHLHSRKQ
jgi:glycosyltransferase involved in cell wall biosynthesis